MGAATSTASSPPALRRAREAPHRAVGPAHRRLDAWPGADGVAGLPLDRPAAARRARDVRRRRVQRRPGRGRRQHGAGRHGGHRRALRAAPTCTAARGRPSRRSGPLPPAEIPLGCADPRIQRQLRRHDPGHRHHRRGARGARARHPRRRHEPARDPARRDPAHRLRERHRPGRPQRRAARLLHALPAQRPGRALGGQVREAGGGRPVATCGTAPRRRRRAAPVACSRRRPAPCWQARRHGDRVRRPRGGRGAVQARRRAVADDTSRPTRPTWKTTSASDGPHTPTATARDAAGKPRPHPGRSPSKNTDTDGPIRVGINTPRGRGHRHRRHQTCG